MIELHWNFVAAAYAVFALGLAIDYFSPKIQLRQLMRKIQLRLRRQSQKTS